MNTVDPACRKVHGCKTLLDVRSICSWSQSESAILSYNRDVRSAHLLGQLSLDKTLTLQAVFSVSGFESKVATQKYEGEKTAKQLFYKTDVSCSG